jgi:hypothetical protein
MLVKEMENVNSPVVDINDNVEDNVSADVDSCEENIENEAITLIPEIFDEYLEDVKVPPAMVEDLYKFSKKSFFGYLIRLCIIAVVTLLIVIVAINVSNLWLKSIFMLGAFTVPAVSTMDGIVIKYSYKDVLWFKKRKIDKAYLALVTRKLSLPNNGRAFELNHDVFLNIKEHGTYASIDLKEVVLVFVREDEYRVVGTESFLGIKVDRTLMETFNIQRREK